MLYRTDYPAHIYVINWFLRFVPSSDIADCTMLAILAIAVYLSLTALQWPACTHLHLDKQSIAINSAEPRIYTHYYLKKPCVETNLHCNPLAKLHPSVWAGELHIDNLELTPNTNPTLNSINA